MTENDDIYESAADELNAARNAKQIVSILNDYADLAQGNPELLQREEDLLAIVWPQLYKVHASEERVLLNLPSIDADEVLGELEGYAILRKNPSGYTAVCMDEVLGELEGYVILCKNPSGYTAVCMDDLARLR